MRIVACENLIRSGSYAASSHWKAARDVIHNAVMKCDWPEGSGTFTINPERKGNGVVPIKREFLNELRLKGWLIEGSARNKSGELLGNFDAVTSGPNGPLVAEWERGNISSSHRSMNKMLMLLSQGVIAAGVMIIPSKQMYI